MHFANYTALAAVLFTTIIFYKNTGLIFAQNLRTNICNSSIKQNRSKCRTICKLHFASCLFMYNCSSQLCKHKQRLI